MKQKIKVVLTTPKQVSDTITVNDFKIVEIEVERPSDKEFWYVAGELINNGSGE